MARKSEPRSLRTLVKYNCIHIHVIFQRTILFHSFNFITRVKFYPITLLEKLEDEKKSSCFYWQITEERIKNPFCLSIYLYFLFMNHFIDFCPSVYIYLSICFYPVLFVCVVFLHMFILKLTMDVPASFDQGNLNKTTYVITCSFAFMERPWNSVDLISMIFSGWGSKRYNSSLPSGIPLRGASVARQYTYSLHV